MFGREYANHLDILIQSFEQINENYQNKIKTGSKKNLAEKFKKLYISIFGIPEIGFQIRGLYFKKILASHLLNKNLKKILDAGSGIGICTFLLATTFPKSQVTGIDLDRNKLKSCKIMAEELKIKNVEFTYLDVLKLSKSDYDLIINIDVLEHVKNYELVLRNFYSTLNKSGYLYIHVPQPNQKRIFTSFKTWRHEDHVREGITRKDLENSLEKLGFKIIVSKETFGFFGKLAWEINHLMLTRSFVLAGITFPFLFALAILDPLWKNNDGLGITVLAQKK